MDPALAGPVPVAIGVDPLPTVVYAGEPFFASAYAALRGRRLGMDVPISATHHLGGGHEPLSDRAQQ
ncbi:MAG: hypothetical protein R3D01_04455 [Hyphomicrobiales bacterium]